MRLIPNSFGSMLMESNDCHEPAGKPTGGQFCSKSGGGLPSGVADHTGPDGDGTRQSQRHFRGWLEQHWDRDEVSWWGFKDIEEILTFDALVTAHVKDLMGTAPIGVNISRSLLPTIAADGRFKNQFETGTSHGHIEDDPRKRESPTYPRRVTEQALLGIPVEASAEARPIYGWIGQPAIGFGGVEVTLKPAVRARATFTMGDSFGFGARGVVVGMAQPVSAPTTEAFYAHHRVALAGMMRQKVAVTAKLARAGTPTKPTLHDTLASLVSWAKVPYCEVQIHGGVHAGDIQTITVGRSGSDGDLAAIRRLFPGVTVQRREESD